LIEGEILADGAFLRAYVRFGAIPEAIEVGLLIDTGAARTTLMPSDIAPLGAFAMARLSSHLRPSVVLEGIGGAVRTYTTEASIELRHSDGSTSALNLDLLLVVDRSALDVPSVLGRDILFRGQVSAGRDGVTFDVEPGEHDLTA
jgi:hypothetical protein